MVSRAEEAGGAETTRLSAGQPLRSTGERVQRWVGGALVVVAMVLLTSALLTTSQALSSPPEPNAVGRLAPTTRATSTPSEARPTIRRAITSGSSTRPPVSAAKAGRSTPAKRDLRPARIRIPALRVDRGPVPLRVLEDGSLEAPPRYVDVGWWQDGPLPGAAGNTVVVGHLDSKTGPAVFYGLAALRWGDEVTVTRRDASTVHYRVRSVQRFPAKDFPATRVYRRDGPPGLALITCGGQYDRTAGRYLDNVVVFADRVR